MRDHNLKGEERFGLLFSLAYWPLAKIPSIQSFYSFVTKDLEGSKAKTILDVGAGTSDIAIKLARSNRFEIIYSIDPSKYMVKISRFRSRRLRNIKIALGSSYHIPFNRRFDIIYTSISFHHWARKAEALKYLVKFLNKNGEIRIYEFQRARMRGFYRHIASHSVEKDEVYEIARDAGLRVKSLLESGRFIRFTLAT